MPDALARAAREVGTRHPRIVRILAFGPALEDDPNGDLRWLVIVDRRDRSAEAAAVRDLREATGRSCDFFVTDERRFQMSERPGAMADELARAVRLYVRDEPRA